MTETDRNPTLAEVLSQRLAQIKAQGLYRELRRLDSPQGSRIQWQGRTLLNFSANDYLGLANDPVTREAAREAVERFGAGSGASRLICGSLQPHHLLEETLAAFKGVEAVLTFSSGYAAALGVISALLGAHDVIILDKLVHASIVDAARLSGAKMRIFAHNDLEDLEQKLKWAAQHRSPAVTGARPGILVVTESVFSMDGDMAPLPAIARLKDHYGAWLMVDEAHATGLYGRHRRGLCEAMEVAAQVDIQMGTLSKAIGSAGGFIAGSRVLIDYLVNRARSLIYSTAPTPAAAAAARAAIEFIQSPAGELRLGQLWDRARQLRHGLAGSPWSIPEPLPPHAEKAIIPLIIGPEQAAVDTALTLRQQGFLIPAIRYPTVARGSARLRLTLSAAHTAADVAQLAASLRDLPVAIPT